MNTAQQHIIKRASLDFTYRGKEDGFALQKEVKDWLQQLLHELQSELDLYCSADEVIALDELKLEINIQHKQWKEEAKQKLRFQLKDKLQLLRSGSVITVGYKEIKLAKHFEEEFLFYLQHGYSSWRSSAVQKENWSKSVIQLLNNPPIYFLQQILQLLKQNEHVFIRLKDAVQETKLFNLFLPLFASDQTYKLYVQDVHAIVETVKNNEQQKDRLAKAHLHITANWQNQAYVSTSIGSLLQQMVQTDAAVRTQIQAVSFQSPLFKEAEQHVHKERTIQYEFKEQTETAFTRKQYLDETALNKLLQEEQRLQLQLIEKEGIYISNVGLVIIAAFLPAMFSKLNLVSDNVITNKTDAVCLVHVIATGKTPVNEIELVVPKLLCGLQPSAAIETGNFQLSDAMVLEVTNMLSSVIEYWNVLGDTSVEGLRESFLQRNGKLSLRNNEWMIQAEQQPYDMLLQHLPWNMTMIQLPWMSEMLKTEWIY